MPAIVLLRYYAVTILHKRNSIRLGDVQMVKAREDSDETVQMMIRPTKGLAAWYAERAARELLEKGRKITPNKLMVEDLELVRNGQLNAGGKSK